MSSGSFRKIAVTGGAGFLGSHIVRMLLVRGERVAVLDDFSNGKVLHLQEIKDHPSLSIIRGDITKKEDVARAFEGCDAMIHMAVLDLRQSIKEPERVNQVIVDGTLNCLDFALKEKIKLFLNCSSSEVYGTAAYTPMDEEHPLHPETPYAAAKVAQDMYVFSYGRTYGLPWVTVRPFNMYGPHSHWQGYRGELIPKMIVRAMNREPLVIFGEGDQTRDFIYVGDAAKGVLAVLDNPSVRNLSVNFCSGIETSVKAIAVGICEKFALDPKVYIKRQPSRPGDVQRHLGDNRKFKSLLGLVPETKLSEGLEKTVSWFRCLPFSPKEMLSGEILRNWE